MYSLKDCQITLSQHVLILQYYHNRERGFQLRVNDKKDLDTGKLSDSLDSYNSPQLIQMPNHFFGNTLDLLITLYQIKNYSVIFIMGNLVQKMKSIDHNAMKNDLQELAKSCFEEDNLDTLVVASSL